MSGSMAVEESAEDDDGKGRSIGIGAGRDDPPRGTKARRATVVECVDTERGAKPEAKTTLPLWSLTFGDRNWRESSGMVW